MKTLQAKRSAIAASRGRGGITLLEVLIAMGVMAVGLLGLASLLPVARFYMADGSKYDHTAVLGQQAMNYLECRQEMRDPQNWFAPAGNGQFLEVCPKSTTLLISGVSYTFDSSYNYLWPTVSPIPTIPAAPFILDPLACAFPSNLQQNGGTAAAAGNGQIGVAGNFGPLFFPPSGYSLDEPGGVGTPFGAPALARVTFPMSRVFGPLAPELTGAGLTAASADYEIDKNAAGNRFCRPMTYATAQTIFTSTDDPVFSLPKDPTARPFVQLPTAATGTQWSRTQGDYSWFAVIDNVQRPWNPGPDQAWGNAALDDNLDLILNDASEAGWPTGDDFALWQQSGGELWHVSIVVVHKRNLQLVPPSIDEIPPERMCYCDFLNAPLPVDITTAQGQATVANAGLGGGDCVLYVPVGMAPSQEWLNVKPNQWIMLSGFPNLAQSLANPPVHSQLAAVQWFRLSAVGEIQAVTDASGNVTAWQRAVTLSGPDLNPYKFMDAVGAPGGNQSLYATIIDGVTGVFEATIEQGQ